MLLRLRRYRFLAFAAVLLIVYWHYRGISSKSRGPAPDSVESLKQYDGTRPAGTGVEGQKGPARDGLQSGLVEGSQEGKYVPQEPLLVGADSNTPDAADGESPSAKPAATFVNQEAVLEGPAAKTPAASSTGTYVFSESTTQSYASTSSPRTQAELTSTPVKPKPVVSPTALPKLKPEIGSEGQLSQPSLSEHWSKGIESFPVTALITLPTGKPKPIPKIQRGEFPAENAAEKAERLQKLSAITSEFKYAWNGYKDQAWMHDELKPETGGYRDPFCGWAATLVDTLDTLWILGLEDEFNEAVLAINRLDFTTTSRDDIPLFETTIRYLGGLIAAYDISGAKHRNLLNKAVELAEVLMGVFDTPNRMPVTYYKWKRTFASQPHRASTRVVLAELGSLSLEFTRLAQITKEDKYYDAIARITNALEDWQDSTSLPGLWPLVVDASGCNRSGVQEPLLVGGSQQSLNFTKNTKKIIETVLDPQGPAAKGRKREAPSLLSTNQTTSHLPSSSNDNSEAAPQVAPAISLALIDDKIDCEPQGLSSPPGTDFEEFSLGGRSDSAYEYLPKAHILLGGLNDQYKKMYLKSAKVFKKHLFKRPMTKDGREVLISGLLQNRVNRTLDPPQWQHILRPEQTHLTCFVGGMLGMGSRIFDQPADLDLAKKLTDGCVWAYESTTAGIMPEIFLTVPCLNQEHCPWNETYYREALDPNRLQRSEYRQSQLSVQGDGDGRVAREPGKTFEEKQAEAALERGAQALKSLKEELTMSNAPTPTLETTGSKPTFADKAEVNEAANGVDTREESSLTTNKSRQKRHGSHGGSLADRLGGKSDEHEDHAHTPDSPPSGMEKLPKLDVASNVAQVEAALSGNAPTVPEHGNEFAASLHYTAPLPLSHEDYVADRITRENLPPGFDRIVESKYILRPEAIESVFIMYRITGEKYWRDKGWKMFLAIVSATRTSWGHTAIDDVMNKQPRARNSMESFWLAETLKYFYLLFSDEDLVSLDDWVLNTEAHPFRRPDNTKKH